METELTPNKLKELKKFVKSHTLKLQQWRSLSDKQRDQLFQDAYRWYCELQVDSEEI